MSKRINMPKLGMTMTEGTIDEWYKSVGDTVKKGEAVCMIASEKLTMDVESPADGTLIEITVEAGGLAKVGDQMGLIGVEGESAVSKASGDDEALSESGEPTNERQAIQDAAEKSDSFERTHDNEINQNAIEEEKHPTEQGNVSAKRVFITPLAKKIAKEKGIDYTQIKGTGGNGRITKRDVEKAPAQSASPQQNVAQVAVPQSVTPKNLSPMRSAIASNMMNSLQTTAQLTLHQKANADKLFKFNKTLKDEVSNSGLDIKVTVTALITKAVSLALKDDIKMNSTYKDGTLEKHDTVNIGIATSLDDGLMVPVILDAASKSIGDIAAQIVELSDAARNGSLESDKMSGGTFTITNIGTSGIEYFTPVLNAPEVGILGVGSLQKELKLVDGKVKEAKILPFSLTIDHQIVDGADGANFLTSLIKYIENPYLLVL
ncbi:dihydrolipoamide acetyltransferase family protein [Macrococcus animalis]|uniref:dihydrolipoamide acetyltransferase family protein n=1 Tax=Macrococcus animalis TaxID=3395467 RepID=UPI0039BDC7A9